MVGVTTFAQVLDFSEVTILSNLYINISILCHLNFYTIVPFTPLQLFDSFAYFADVAFQYKI